MALCGGRSYNLGHVHFLSLSPILIQVICKKGKLRPKSTVGFFCLQSQLSTQLVHKTLYPTERDLVPCVPTEFDLQRSSEKCSLSLPNHHTCSYQFLSIALGYCQPFLLLRVFE